MYAARNITKCNLVAYALHHTYAPADSCKIYLTGYYYFAISYHCSRCRFDFSGYKTRSAAHRGVSLHNRKAPAKLEADLGHAFGMRYLSTAVHVRQFTWPSRARLLPIAPRVVGPVVAESRAVNVGNPFFSATRCNTETTQQPFGQGSLPLCLVLEVRVSGAVDHSALDRRGMTAKIRSSGFLLARF